MKRISMTLFSMLAGLMLSFSPANAQPFWVGTVYDGLGGSVSNVMGFDWSSSGSGVALSLGPMGTVPTPGTVFDFYYQAQLVGLTDPVGNPLAFPGLNSTFEYTIVAKIPEVVLTFTPFGLPFPPNAGTAVFATLPGGEFYILRDTPNSVVATGVGFDDGTVAARGTISAGQVSSFTATSLTQGIGSFIFKGLVDVANPLYFDPALTIFDFRAEGTLNIPALDSTTSGFFMGPGVYADYGPLAPDDLRFKVDASSKFSVIPEPSTMILMGAGLIGLAAMARRRKI